MPKGVEHERFKRFRHLRMIVVSFKQLSTFIMSTTRSRSKFPTAYLSGQQIQYVAENPRDAEAVSSSVECPVVLANAQELRAFGQSKRRKSLGVSDVQSVQEVLDALGDPNVSEVLDVPGVSESASVSDALDDSDVSDVQASDL